MKRSSYGERLRLAKGRRVRVQMEGPGEENEAAATVKSKPLNVNTRDMADLD